VVFIFQNVEKNLPPSRGGGGEADEVLGGGGGGGVTICGFFGRGEGGAGIFEHGQPASFYFAVI